MKIIATAVVIVLMAGIVAGDRVYTGFTGPLSWSAAKTECETESGRELARITSDSERDAAFLVSGDANTWIGATDMVDEGTWTWSDGTNVVYTNWADGEPNETGSEDCVTTGRFSTAEWNDDHCPIAYAYLCSECVLSITCPADVSVAYDADSSPAGMAGMATALGGCGEGAPVHSDVSAPATGNDRVITCTWTVTAPGSLPATCVQTVTVYDHAEWSHGTTFDSVTVGTDEEESGCSGSGSNSDIDGGFHYEDSSNQYYHGMTYELHDDNPCHNTYAYASYRYQWTHCSGTPCRPDMSRFSHFSVWARTSEDRQFRFKLYRSGGAKSEYYTIEATAGGWKNYVFDVSDIQSTVLDKLKSVHWSTNITGASAVNVDFGHMSFTNHPMASIGIALPVAPIAPLPGTAEWAYISNGEIAADPDSSVRRSSSSSVTVSDSFVTGGVGPGTATAHHRVHYTTAASSSSDKWIYAKYYYQVQDHNSARPDMSALRKVSVWVRNSLGDGTVHISYVRSGHGTPDKGWVTTTATASACTPAANTWTECVFFVNEWWEYDEMKYVSVRLAMDGGVERDADFDVAYIRYTNDVADLNAAGNGPQDDATPPASTVAATAGGSSAMMALVAVCAVVALVAVGAVVRRRRQAQAASVDVELSATAVAETA